MKERNKAVPAVYLLLVCDHEVLLGLRQNTGYQDGNWNLPSGHIEAGELPLEALIRETKEEVGIDVEPHDLHFVHVSYRPKHDETGDRVDFFFVAHNWTGEITNAEPDKCAEWAWFNVHRLPENVTPHVRSAIDNIGLWMGRNKYYSELSTDWLKEKGVYLLEV